MRARRTGLSSPPSRTRSCSRRRSLASVRTPSPPGFGRRKPSDSAAAPNHANDPDQQTGADKAENQVADPSAEHDPKNTENGAGDRRADDAENDIHQHARIALHE